VDHRLFIPLLIATLIAFPLRSRADDAQWESLRVYPLAGGQSVAVAVPAERKSVLRPEDLRKIALASR